MAWIPPLSTTTLPSTRSREPSSDWVQNVVLPPFSRRRDARPADVEVLGQLGAVEFAVGRSEVDVLVDANEGRLRGGGKIRKAIGRAGEREVLADQARLPRPCPAGPGGRGVSVTMQVRREWFIGSSRCSFEIAESHGDVTVAAARLA
jgi:hypothetical protein